MHQRIKSQGVECLKRRFVVGGCLITLDWRCKLGVLNWENISNYLHLWNMFIYLFMCFFIYFLIYLHATYLFVVSLGTKSCFMFCCFVIWSVFDYIFGKQVYNHFDPSWPRKKQYIPLSSMINFSLQLFQLTEACFRLWIVFVASIVIYLSLYFDVIVCIGVFKI